jgi:hypothetical protein
MGSQGMKRKGRKHLPKAGTRPDEDYVLKRSREDVVNFGRHRAFGSGGRILMVAVAVIAVLCLVAFFAFT